MERRNLFITFEGIEGCGKSTQSKLLKKFLTEQGKNVVFTREPGGTPISEKIRNILLDPENIEMLPETEVLLYMASRSQHTGEKILPSLKENIVISDRYYDSSLVYQGVARNLDLAVLKKITKFATYNTKPDITFLIDLPAEIGLSRIETKDADRIEQESLDFHKKVRKGFLNLANSEKERFYIIDGSQSIEKIHADIIKVIKNFEVKL